MSVEEINVTSLSAYITAIETITKTFSCPTTDTWYRGVSDDTYSLVPGVVWRKIDEDMHASMVVEFLTKGILYDSELSTLNGYDAYAIMQHFGLPTKLLDWSSSPLIALFFALEKDEKRNKRVVWAMNPAKLNKFSVGFEWFLFPHDSFTCNNYQLHDLLPDTFNSGTGRSTVGPLAIRVQPKNRRIKSQSGCFTIHGSSKGPIDKIFVENECKEIIKITVNGPRVRRNMLSSLRLLGVTEDTIYQDLPSLSEKIKREYLTDGIGGA